MTPPSNVTPRTIAKALTAKLADATVTGAGSTAVVNNIVRPGVVKPYTRFVVQSFVDERTKGAVAYHHVRLFVEAVTDNDFEQAEAIYDAVHELLEYGTLNLEVGTLDVMFRDDVMDRPNYTEANETIHQLGGTYYLGVKPA